MPEGFRESEHSELNAVNELLNSRGLGLLSDDEVSTPMGRNKNWLGETTAGRRIFAKILEGPQDSVDSRVNRILAYESHLEANPGMRESSPAVLAVDRLRGTLIFEGIKDGRTLAEEYVEGNELGSEYSGAVGGTIGQLHASTPVSAVDYDRSLPSLPRTDQLDAISLDAFVNCTWGELEAVRLHQGDEDLRRAILGLRDDERLAEQVPSHCDLRLDQVMVGPSGATIVDWEEFRLADPARDVGSFVGDWLHRAVLGIVQAPSEGEGVAVELDHDEVIRRGLAEILKIRPQIEAFWSSYRAFVPEPSAGLVERATRFAGWHMQDRMLVGGQFRSFLPSIDRAAAGIGRELLMRPLAFAGSIGLELEVTHAA